METQQASDSGLLGDRYALVIGNSNYQDADPVSGVKDAEFMAKYLAQIGFDVLPPVLDGTLAKMTKALDALEPKIADASVVVVAFSGHGFQNSGENFLMPKDGTIDPRSCIPLKTIQDKLSKAPLSAVKIVFLDACRPERRLNGKPLGLDPDQAPPLAKTLYAFASGAGLLTPAGSPDGFSTYSEAILRYLREPGLSVVKLLEKVSDDLAKVGLVPASVNHDVPTDFFLRPPVDVEANVTQVDDDLLMLLGDEIAIASNQQRQKSLRLKAGDNPFALAVSNAKSFHNNHDWSVTEGWNYELRLGLPDGTEHVFKDEGEKNPFKEGPHHGKVFVVARANLFVHPETAKVSVKNPEPKVWEDETPIFAKDQAILYEKSVTELPIDLDEIISDAFHLNGFLAPVVLQILKTGTFLGATIADPSKTFVLVLGNRAIQDLVDFCMNEQKEDRMRDLKASLAAVLARNPRPFDIFDQNLNTALRQEAERRGRTDIPLDQIRVWTAVDDRSKS